METTLIFSPMKDGFVPVHRANARGRMDDKANTYNINRGRRGRGRCGCALRARSPDHADGRGRRA